MHSVKLLLDMGLSPATAAALRYAGYDAVHLVDRDAERLSDESILRIAQSEERIVLTFDLDFPRLLAMQRSVQASVVLFRVESITTDRMTAWLLGVLPALRKRSSSRGYSRARWHARTFANVADLAMTQTRQ